MGDDGTDSKDSNGQAGDEQSSDTGHSADEREPDIVRSLNTPMFRNETFPSFDISSAPDIPTRSASPIRTTYLAISILVGITGSIFGVFLIFGRPSHPLAGSFTIAASWLAGLVVWAVFLHFRARRMRAQEAADRSRQAAERKKRVRAPDERDANQQALARYQYLTQGQATSSYRLAQAAILAGLLILLGGVAITVRTSGTTTQLVVGGLTALGSSISAYVGATSIRVYNRTLSQLNFYYAQPLVQSYVLQAESLSDKLGPDRKDDVLEKIIDQILMGASVASQLIARPGETQISRRLWPRNRRGSPEDANPNGN